jgi:hypothetical protein
MSAAVEATFSRSIPLTWTSIGAGSPRFRTASTRPPDWKYVWSSGISFCNAARTRFMYS